MNCSKACLTVGCFAWVSTLVFAAEMCANPGCGNEAASASVGACVAEYQDCEGLEKKGVCDFNQEMLDDGTPELMKDIRIVNQDFPTKCKDSQGTNCNEPTEKCWIRAVCKWEDDKCRVSGSNGFWHSEKKRTTCECQPGM